MTIHVCRAIPITPISLMQTCQVALIPEDTVTYSKIWKNLLSAVKNYPGCSTLNVTRRKLVLKRRDDITGWYAKTYRTFTIKMVLVSKGTSLSALSPGTYVRKDALGLTADVVVEGDEIYVNNKYYEVESIQEHYVGDSFSHYDCDLTLLQFKNLTGATYTPSNVEDARYRTKDYLEKHLNNAALPTYIVAYGIPDYSLVHVFKNKGVDLVYSIGTPNSVALPLGSGYEEAVPITICCINKSNINGTKLRWQAETELRRIAETYPMGSLRTLDRLTDKEERLGSTVLYSVEYVMRYTRYA